MSDEVTCVGSKLLSTGKDQLLYREPKLENSCAIMKFTAVFLFVAFLSDVAVFEGQPTTTRLRMGRELHKRESDADVQRNETTFATYLESEPLKNQTSEEKYLHLGTESIPELSPEEADNINRDESTTSGSQTENNEAVEPATITGLQDRGTVNESEADGFEDLETESQKTSVAGNDKSKYDVATTTNSSVQDNDEVIIHSLVTARSQSNVTETLNTDAVLTPAEDREEKAIVDNTSVVNSTNASYKLVCYFASWASTRVGKGRFFPEDIDDTLCTHIIYAFAEIENDHLAIIDSFELKQEESVDLYKRTTNLKTLNPNLKILLSLGGWRFGSAGFKRISKTKESRKYFTSHTPSFLRKHDFDGLDLDWQFPKGRNEKWNFVLLIKDLREAFEKDARDTGLPRLLLSSTLPFGADNIRDGIAVPINARYLDFMSVTSYDFHGPWERTLGHSSQLFAPSTDTGLRMTFSMSYAANMMASLGVPKEKLMLGMPLFGRIFSPKNLTCTSIGCPSKEYDVHTKYTNDTKFAAYYEVCEHLHNGGEYVWNEALEVPYMVKDDLWISFDDERSIRNKMKWIKANGFGGAMVWSVDVDDFSGTMCGGNLKYPLIGIMSEELLGTPRRGNDVDWPNIVKSSVDSKVAKSNMSVDDLPARITSPWMFLSPEWEVYNDTQVGTIIENVTVKQLYGDQSSTVFIIDIKEHLLGIHPQLGYVYVAKNLSDQVGYHKVSVTAKSALKGSDEAQMVSTKEEVEMFIKARPVSSSSDSTLLIVAIVMPLLLLFLLFVGCYCWCRRWKEQHLTDYLKEMDDVGVDGRNRRTPSMADKWEFNRYDLTKIEKLGEGYFAEVWKCKAEGLNGIPSSLVAVKLLKDTVTGREQHDFRAELSLLKTLEKHCNVLSLLGCCTDQHPVYIILEYMEGGKLETYLRSARPDTESSSYLRLTSSDLVRFIHQISCGMEFLSLRGIIHRDLATRNILLNEKNICKVADFGFARDISHSLIYEREGDDRLPIRWMSPESIDDNIHTLKSDVWSFGILMWEVATLGTTPYPGMRGVEAARLIRTGERLEKPPHCSEDIYDVMLKCWEGRPDDRPSFSDLVCIFEKFKENSESGTEYIRIQDFRNYSSYKILTDMTDELV